MRFSEPEILYNHQFDKVDWEMVHTALYCVPRMFQIWACKKLWILLWPMEIGPGNNSSALFVQVVHRSPKRAPMYSFAIMLEG
jgi:hypothetical protein